MEVLLSLSAFAGFVAHLLFFIRGEWHLQGSFIVLVHITIAIGLTLLLYISGEKGLAKQAVNALKLFSTYVLSLAVSIVTYRVLFHRLRRFPGPKLAAVTKLWHVYHCFDSRNHLLLNDLCNKYGSFVRTGPEKIIIFHPGAIELLDGHGNRNGKSDWCDLLRPRTSTIFCRSEALHLARRRVWKQALSTRAITSYLPRILDEIETLENLISTSGKDGVLLNDAMSWYSFDSMGEFAFNKSFGMMKSKAWHEAATQQRAALQLLGPFGSAIWIVVLAFACTPFLNKIKQWTAMTRFCDSCMVERMKTEPEQPDMAQWFIEECSKETSKTSLQERQSLLSGNAISVIVGGRNKTVNTSLQLLCFTLANYPQHADEIYNELSGINESDPAALSALTHLNGFIKEVMRLYPAAMTGANRIAPAEGLWVGDTFIPGGTKIAAPKYPIFRLPSAFEHPTDFIPERWTTRPELVKNKKAFAPFGIGRRACVGKNLALTQIRLVAGVVLKKIYCAFCQGPRNQSDRTRYARSGHCAARSVQGRLPAAALSTIRMLHVSHKSPNAEKFRARHGLRPW